MTLYCYSFITQGSHISTSHKNTKAQQLAQIHTYTMGLLCEAVVHSERPSETDRTCDSLQTLQHPHDHTNAPWSGQACILNQTRSNLCNTNSSLHHPNLYSHTDNWTTPTLIFEPQQIELPFLLLCPVHLFQNIQSPIISTDCPLLCDMKLVWGLLLNMEWMKSSLFSLLCFVVCVQASPRRCEGGGRVEEVLRAEEAPRRAGLHTQEPVQKTGGVPTFSPCTGFW